MSHPKIVESFEAYYILLKIVEYRRQILELTDSYGIPTDVEKKREYEGRISELFRYAHSMGLMLSRCHEIENNAEIQKILDSLIQSKSPLVVGNLSEAFKKHHETGSFFHFSVLDEADDTIESCIKEMMTVQ